MTRAERIRKVLRASAEPMTSAEIMALVPGIRTHHAIGAMYRQGHVDRSGERGSYRYWLAREPVSRKLYTAEERKARRAERERIRGAKRRRETGALPFADALALRRAEAARKKAERDADRAKDRAEREAARIARMNDPTYLAQRAAAKAEANRKNQAKRRAAAKKAKAARLAAEAKKRTKVNTAYNCVIEPPRPQLEDAPKRVVVAETVEEFRARGGVVEVLPGVGEMVRAAA